MSSIEPAFSSALDALDTARLRRLVEVGPTLGADLHLDGVLDRLLTVARELTGARYAAVGVLAPDRRQLERFVTQGIGEGERGVIGDLPRGHGVLGVLITEPKPLRLPDVSEHPLSYGFPPGHPPMTTFLGVPVEAGGEVWGNLYLTDKDGNFDEADEQVATVLARWAGLAVEHARLHESTSSQRDELAYAVRALEATTLISRALGAEVELEPTLELVVKRGRALADARSMLILLADGDELVFTAMAGEASTELCGARLPQRGSASGRAFLSGQIQRVPDFAEQITMTARRTGLNFSPRQFVGPGVHPALFVPMSYRGHMVGVLNTIGRVTKEGPFSEAEEQLILSFAASAATAVAAAQSVESERVRRSMRAMEEERSRWARELHDETLQGLGGLRLMLASARKLDDPAALDNALERALDQVTQEIRNLRALITDLRPASLDEIGLGPALAALIEQRRDRSSLELVPNISLRHEAGEESTRLAPELETAVYRLVQEALTNAIKHSGAKRVRVDVVEQPGRVLVSVADDGVGFDPDGSHEGFGLASMRERVSLADGELRISSDSHGTRLEAEFPVKRVEAAPLPAATNLRLATERDAG
jgi:signal transduction histidine kinase